MAEQLISEFLDLPALKAQGEEFVVLLKSIKQEYQNLGNAKVDLSFAKSFKDTTAAINDVNDATKQAEKSTISLTKAQQDAANASKKAVDAKNDEIRINKLAEYYKKQEAEATKLQIQALKDDIKGRADAVGYYKRLNDEYQKAALLSKNLAAQQGIGSVAAKEAALAAKLLSDELKAIDSTVGISTRKVGDYNAGIKEVAVVSGQSGNAVGRLYGLIRTAANILPGIGISGIFLLLFEGISKAATALGIFTNESDKAAKKSAEQKKSVEELIDSFRTLEEIQNAAFGATDADAIKVQALASVVSDQTETYERRNSALLKLKDINKNYFGDLTLETATIQVLSKAVSDYTDAIINEAVIKELSGDISKVAIAYERQLKATREADAAVRQNRDAIFYANQAAIAAGKTIFDNTGKSAALNENLKAQTKLLQPLADQFNQLKNELIDYQKRALDFKPLKKEGSDKTETKLKTFDSKPDDSVAKYYIDLEKQISQGIDVELSARLTLRKEAFAEEYTLLLSANNREKKVAQDKLNDVLNSKAGNNERINAEREYHATLETLQNKFTAESELLEIKLQDDLTNIQATARAKRLADDKRDNEAFEAQQKAAFDARVKARQKLVENNSSKSTIAQDDELKSLQQVYAAGLISTEEYQKRKYDIEKRFEIQATADLVNNAQFLIDHAKEYGADVVAQEKIIAEARKKLSDQLTNDLIANEDKLRDERKKITQQIVAGIGELIDDGYDKQKNAIQDQINTLQLQKAAEVDAVNTSTATAADKAAQIALINERADDQQKNLEKRQKDEDVKKAEFDKIIAEIQIEQSTQAAVQALQVKAAIAKAQGDLLAADPVTASYASIAYASAASIAAQIPIVIAEGIISAALVAAKPIPRYKTGVTNAPGGLSVLGDGGVHEVLETKDGTAYLTPKTDTLVDIPEGSNVYSDINKYLYKKLGPVKSTTDSGAVEVVANLKILQQDVRNIKQTTNKATFMGLVHGQQMGTKWVEYVNRNIRW